MFRRIEDFTAQWPVEREATLRVLRLLTDESLSQAVVPGGRTIGFLAWHMVVSFREMLGRTGLEPRGPEPHEPVPDRAADIVQAYDTASAAVLDEVTSKWTDDTLTEMADMYGERWTRGFVLETLIRHEAHHRGQIAVLMRQAGLPMAGPYGPSREEWAQMGMEAHP